MSVDDMVDRDVIQNSQMDIKPRRDLHPELAMRVSTSDGPEPCTCFPETQNNVPSMIYEGVCCRHRKKQKLRVFDSGWLPRNDLETRNVTRGISSAGLDDNGEFVADSRIGSKEMASAECPDCVVYGDNGRCSACRQRQASSDSSLPKINEFQTFRTVNQSTQVSPSRNSLPPIRIRNEYQVDSLLVKSRDFLGAYAPKIDKPIGQMKGRQFNGKLYDMAAKKMYSYSVKQTYPRVPENWNSQSTRKRLKAKKQQ